MFEGAEQLALQGTLMIMQRVASSGKVRFAPAKTIQAIEKGSPPRIIELFRAERLLFRRCGGGKNLRAIALTIFESEVQACPPLGNTFIASVVHWKGFQQEKIAPIQERSEERRVGKEGRARWSPYQ